MRLQPIIAAFFIFPFLASCALPPTGNPGGAAIGGAIGAGSLALLGADKPFILFGGLLGAGLGYYATTLRFAAGPIIQAGGQAYTLGDSVGIEIPTNRLFEENTAYFLPGTGPILNSVLDILKRYPNHNILVSGNSSGFGSSRNEQKLSEDRARQVSAYLWSNGIGEFKERSFDVRKLVYVGYGNYFPIANSLHSNSICANSRIQITAYPSTSPLAKRKEFKPFSNIGADQPEVCLPQDFSKEFPPDLP